MQCDTLRNAPRNKEEEEVRLAGSLETGKEAQAEVGKNLKEEEGGRRYQSLLTSYFYCRIVSVQYKVVPTSSAGNGRVAKLTCLTTI